MLDLAEQGLAALIATESASLDFTICTTSDESLKAALVSLAGFVSKIKQQKNSANMRDSRTASLDQ